MKKSVQIMKTITVGVDSFETSCNVEDKFHEMEGFERILQKVFFINKTFENDQVLDYERKDGCSVHMNLHKGVRMQLHVKVSWSDQNLVSLDVHSWDTIADVKTKFQDKEGTPANQLTFIYGRRPFIKQLDDDFKTLEAYYIENDSTLDAFSLGEDKIVILVHSPGKDPNEVMVNLCSTVVNLKRMIHCMGHYAVDRQKLTYNGVVLENGQRLSDYNIQMGSELYLEFIRRTNGMPIFLKTLEGGTFTICADSSDTVATLKTEIRYMKGIPEERLILIFEGKALKNDYTLRDYNIQKECSLHMAFELFDRATEMVSQKGSPTPPDQKVMKCLKVTKTLNLRVKSLDNIDDVKDKLRELVEIETNLQKFFFTEKNFVNDQELDYERKDGYNVHMNLHLGVRMQVHVEVPWGTTTTTAKLISLDVHSWNTISDVKTMFQEKEGTPANQLTLIYEKKQLDDDLQTLAGYDIKNDSIIHAVFLGEDKIKITVSTPRGGRVEVMVKLCSTVKNLKRIIHCMGQLEVYHQKLTFNGVVLENSKRLTDYKIQMGSLLRLL